MKVNWNVPTEILEDDCLHNVRLRDYLPSSKSIPNDFLTRDNTWIQWAEKLISGELDYTTPPLAVKGVNRKCAIMHIMFIHDISNLPLAYRVLIVAYLASLWFEEPIIEL